MGLVFFFFAPARNRSKLKLNFHHHYYKTMHNWSLLLLVLRCSPSLARLISMTWCFLPLRLAIKLTASINQQTDYKVTFAWFFCCCDGEPSADIKCKALSLSLSLPNSRSVSYYDIIKIASSPYRPICRWVSPAVCRYLCARGFAVTRFPKLANKTVVIKRLISSPATPYHPSKTSRWADLKMRPLFTATDTLARTSCSVRHTIMRVFGGLARSKHTSLA